ncbi:MAG: TonB-dependent receptor, partial [Parvularculaceae bacterium]|nr:TonB-dependent receptor [Parvularculaceae bacterium]
LALVYDNPGFATDWGVNAEMRYRDMEYSSGNGFFEGLPTLTLNRMDSAERRRNADIGATYRGFRQHSLRFGAGYQEQDLYEFRQYLDGVPRPLVAPQKRHTRYIYLQDVWQIDADWELTAGVRHDRYSDFGGTTNPRLALVWQASERLTAKLMYGEAFRAPSYLELYLTTTANPPNPALKPETSKTLEASLSWLATRDVRLGINVYDFRRKDVIAPAAVAPYQFQNFPEFNTQGVELEGQWQVSPHLRLAGNYARMWNGAVDDPLRDLAIPLQQAYVRLDWQFRPKWHWNLQLHWFDQRPLVTGDPRREIGDTTLVGTTVRYFHGSEWEFAASIRNLTDTEAYDYSSRSLWYNLPLPGREVWAEARYKF